MLSILFYAHFLNQQRKEEKMLRTLILGVLLTSLFQGCTSSLIQTPEKQYTQERRVALVIGNANYKPKKSSNNKDVVFGPVPSVSNDVDDMTKALRRLGFRVIQAKDANRGSMKRALETFEGELKRENEKTVGLFYFSGHGLEVADETYMIPIGVNPLSPELDEKTLKTETVTRSEVYDVMKLADNRMNFVIFDACRSNSATSDDQDKGGVVAMLKGPSGSIGINVGANPGLAKMPDRSFLAYATERDHTSTGYKSGNSLYTKHLLHFLETPGLSVTELFGQVSKSVETETEENPQLKKQIPYFSSKEMSGNENDFFFKPENITTNIPWVG
jgi:uncharacterized caspase-like protein